MNPIELETVVKNLNNRVDRVEQILPTLARQQDLLAVKQDVLATQRDVLAVKQDVLAVKQDVLDTKQYLVGALSALEERLRSHMLMLHEDTKSDVRLLAENLAGVMQRLDRLDKRSIPPPG